LRNGYNGYVPGFTGHLIGSYHGRAQDCCWVVEGNRLRSPLRPGAITVVPERHDGHWALRGPVEVAHVYLTDERFQHCAAPLTKGRRVELVPRIGFQDPIAATILRMLFEEAPHTDAGSALFIEHALDLLCVQLARAHSTSTVPASATAAKGLTRRQVRVICDYMQEHIDEEISLTDLASLVGLSRFHFCRAFRLATGLAPHAWLSAQRMHQARTLVVTTNLPIAEVSLAVGYRTHSAFAATFRKAFGISPTRLRRQS
jgi:AraC family transcriptional regulator